jgi:hypothetical protein
MGEGSFVRWVVWAIAGFFRSKTSLVAENLCPRQQLLVLRRKHKRPWLQDADRRFWILVHRHRQMIHLMSMQSIDMARMILYRNAPSE